MENHRKASQHQRINKFKAFEILPATSVNPDASVVDFVKRFNKKQAKVANNNNSSSRQRAIHTISMNESSPSSSVSKDTEDNIKAFDAILSSPTIPTATRPKIKAFRQQMQSSNKPKNRFRMQKQQQQDDSHVLQKLLQEQLMMKKEEENVPDETFITETSTTEIKETEVVEKEDLSPVKSVPKTPVDTHSKLHLEIKACLLAKQYGVTIQDLQRMSLDQLERKQQRSLFRATLEGGDDDDNSNDNEFLSPLAIDHQQKTQFIINHYDTTGHPFEKEVINDVVTDWSNTSGSNTSMWEELVAHIENSYFLEKSFDAPSKLATETAFDVLSKVAERVPEYSRILNVVNCALKAAVYDDKNNNELFYETAARTKEDLEKVRAEFKNFKDSTAEAPTTSKILEIFQSPEFPKTEQQGLIRSMIQSSEKPLDASFVTTVLNDMPRETAVPARLQIATDLEESQTLELMKSLIQKKETRLYVADFLSDHPSLAHELIYKTKSNVLINLLEHSISDTSSFLWNAPALVSSIMQSTPKLLERLLEQQSFAVATMLSQNKNLFSNIISYLLRDNLATLEAHFVKKPHVFCDILTHQPHLLTECITFMPKILSEVADQLSVVFAKMYLENPSLLSQILQSNPIVGSTLFSHEPNLLVSAIELCPAALGKILATKPSLIVNAAHRYPEIMSNIMMSNPDMLLTPLENNSAVLATFLVDHPEVLSGPMLDEMNLVRVFIEKADTASQTTQESTVGNTKPPLTKTLIAAIAEDAEASTATLQHRDSKRRRSSNLSITSNSRKSLSLKKRSVVKHSTTWSVPQLLSSISAIYAKKIMCDAADDLAKVDRDSLPETVYNHFLQQTGLKSLAKKTIVGMTSGIKRHGVNVTRIYWFGIFLGVINSQDYTSNAIDAYLQFFRVLYSDTLDNYVTSTESRSEILVPLIKVERAISTYCKTEGVLEEFHNRCIADIRLRAASQPLDGGDSLPPEEAAVVMIDLDQALHYIMIMWFDQQKEVDKEMLQLFNEADADGDGILTFSEFASLVRSRDPQCDERKVLRIFKLCGEDNPVTGEHHVRPAEFAVVMRIYNKRFSNKQIK